MAEPDLRRRRRLVAYCPRCAKRYFRGKPEWRLCLECTVNPRWTTVTAGEFVAKAKRVFPGSYEPVRPIDTAPSARRDPQLRFDGDKAA